MFTEISLEILIVNIYECHHILAKNDVWFHYAEIVPEMMYACLTGRLMEYQDMWLPKPRLNYYHVYSRQQAISFTNL